MEFIHILILSAIQGITEFLPISSQSHLILTSYLLGLKDQGIGFDIALHSGSLIAILIYYRNEIKKILSLTNEGLDYLKLIVIGSIPLPIIGLLFIDMVSINMRSISSIALMTILFAVILYLADSKKKDEITKLTNISIFTIIFIGLMQTLAIMPGVSRSGIVITAALLVNFSREDSIKIAFLLSMPAIFMATVYQSMQLYKIGNVEILNEHLLGIFLSFIFSYITIHLFISTINKISFTPYIIYRLILGVVLIRFI